MVETMTSTPDVHGPQLQRLEKLDRPLPYQRLFLRQLIRPGDPRGPIAMHPSCMIPLLGPEQPLPLLSGKDIQFVPVTITEAAESSSGNSVRKTER